jgi:hypothetical protein
MPFARTREWLAPAKLQFACSAHYLDHVDDVNLSADKQAFLKEIPDAMFRETVRDFMVNQNFRRDYWVRGARRLNSVEQSEALRRQRVVLQQARADVPLKIKGSVGEVTLQVAIYGPILDALADHQPKTLGQIEQLVKQKGVLFPHIREAVLILMGEGRVAVVQDGAVIAQATERTRKMNAFLCRRARGSNDVGHLASPVTGGGVQVGRFQQLFLLARSEGKQQPAEWVQFAWQVLAAQGQTIIKDGKKLETPEENLAELNLRAQIFAEKQLPVLVALGIA